MARVVEARRAVAVNPLKHSAPLGGALAFLGLDRCLPVLHGSQGCASFAKVLLTRHFREAVPLQTTALTEVTGILGAGENLVAALAAVAARHRPALIGVLSTGLTETRGDDVALALREFRAAHPELAGVPVVPASTPDFRGGLERGYAAAVEAILAELAVPAAGVPRNAPPAEPPAARAAPRTAPPPGAVPRQVNLLAGPALSPLDAEEVRGMVESFGLRAVVLPDLAASLDGHLEADWSPLTTGGTTVADVAAMGRSEFTLAVGGTVAGAAALVAERARVPFQVYDHLTGLEAGDRFLADLAALTGRPVPERWRRWRSRLADGLLDAHFELGGRRVALALEPDLLAAVAALLAEVGAEVVAAVAPTPSPVLTRVPCAEVVVGDYADLEERARDGGAELLVAGSHGRRSAARLGIPLFRLGFPVFDRLGAQYLVTAGYRGSMALLFGLANTLLDASGPPGPHPSAGGGWPPGREAEPEAGKEVRVRC